MKCDVLFKPDDVLVKSDFLAADIWCPYQYPEELGELRRWGVEESVLQKAILNRVGAEHCHPCYSIPRHFEFKHRDLLYFAINARVKEKEKTHFGYIVLSDGEATRLVLFIDGNEWGLFSDPEPGDNLDALNALSVDEREPVLKFAICPVNELAGVKLPAEFEVQLD